MRNDVDEDDLINFFYNKLGILLAKDSILFDDLHMAGLDADALMIDLSENYHFSLEKFNPDKYYTPEGEIANIPLTIYRLIFDRKKLLKKEFTLKHLMDVINKGEWFDPE